MKKHKTKSESIFFFFAASIFILSIGIGGCDYQLFEKERSFSICMVTKSDLRERIKNLPNAKEAYMRQMSKFRFDEEKDCYMQDWKVPRGLAYPDRGSDILSINFPYHPDPGKQPERGYIKSYAGQQVMIRPLSSPTFSQSNRFRVDEIGAPTGEFFQGYEVFRDNGIRFRRILYDKKRSEKLITIFLKKDDRITDENISGSITVFTHLSDKFGIIYGVIPNSKYKIDDIDRDIKRKIHSFTH